MKIYLVRHGDSGAGYNDDERTLSPTGQQEVKALAKFLTHQKIEVSHIFHSKKIRAVQTAKILSAFIHSSHPLETKAELDPMGSIDTIIEDINHNQEDILLVGHMPFLGMLIAKLVSNNEYNAIVNLKTACMVCLEEVENRRWVINWMLSPELFAIGKN